MVTKEDDTVVFSGVVSSKKDDGSGDEEARGGFHFLVTKNGFQCDDAAKVVARMKSGTVMRFGEPSTVRADGRAIFNVGLYRVKSPAESTGPWDVLKRVKTIDSGKIFDPIDKNCAPAG